MGNHENSHEIETEALRTVGLEPIGLELFKGRGALSSRSGRFESQSTIRVADDWHQEEPDRPRTTVTIDASRTVIAKNQSPDVPFDQSLNPYRGCEHGCIYCFARPTHAFLNLSPGLDFETKLLVKPRAAEILERQISKPSYKVDTLAMGTNTDPYQPIEREWKVTRSVLETLSRFNHPVSIVTKSALITRDVDILADLAERNLAKVAISVTTLDPRLARMMEPRASAPAKRLDAIKTLVDAGIPTAVLVAPLIPAINDHEIETIVETIAELGAQSAGGILLRLPLELKSLFDEWLRAHFPDRADKVLSLIRQSRGGQLYQTGFGRRMRGDGPYAQLIFDRFNKAIKRFELNRETVPLDRTKFEVPSHPKAQMDLF